LPPVCRVERSRGGCESDWAITHDEYLSWYFAERRDFQGVPIRRVQGWFSRGLVTWIALVARHARRISWRRSIYINLAWSISLVFGKLA